MARKGDSGTEAELKVLFPHKDVKLSTGETVAVAQWNLKTGALLMPRLIALIQRLEGLNAGVDVQQLMASASEECFEIVAATLGWTREQLDEKVTFEDFLSLLQAVLDTSILRKDGGGALPKVVELVSALAPLAQAAATRPASQPPSIS